jgi:hypothetical protein
MSVQIDDKPTQDLSRKELKALAKAKRPWYMKKRFWALGVVGVIAAAAAAGGGGDNSDADPINQSGSESTATESESSTSNDKLFPNRPDSQREDQERNIGGEARLSGYTTTVTAAGFQQAVSDFEEDGYIVADVKIFNRDDKAQPYNVFDWSLQTPNGQVVDIDFTTVETLSSGDLVPGGEVTGKVVFEVGTQKGDFYLIYKPDAFDGARGIWKVTV